MWLLVPGFLLAQDLQLEEFYDKYRKEIDTLVSKISKNKKNPFEFLTTRKFPSKNVETLTKAISDINVEKYRKLVGEDWARQWSKYYFKLLKSYKKLETIRKKTCGSLISNIKGILKIKATPLFPGAAPPKEYSIQDLIKLSEKWDNVKRKNFYTLLKLRDILFIKEYEIKQKRSKIVLMIQYHMPTNVIKMAKDAKVFVKTNKKAYQQAQWRLKNFYK